MYYPKGDLQGEHLGPECLAEGFAKDDFFIHSTAEGHAQWVVAAIDAHDTVSVRLKAGTVQHNP